MYYPSLVLIFTLFAVHQVCKAEFYDMTTEGFLKDCLAQHNYYRALHGCPPLELDYDLIDYSKERAKLQIRKPGNKHKGLVKFIGENLYRDRGYDGPAPCARAIDDWYNEVDLYNYKKPGMQPKAGHFTQLIWKSSTKLGCAMFSGRKTPESRFENYIACHYFPRGNIRKRERFIENVP